MGELYYESQGTSTYLVYAVADEDLIDTMSLGMLTNNKIPGLAPALFTQMDAKKYIKYNVSSNVSVKEFFSGAVNKKRLIGVFKGVVDGLLSAEDYMIDPNGIILNIEYIYANVSTCEAMLICLPIENGCSTFSDIGAFFKDIMVNTQFDSTENSDHLAKIFNFLNSASAFSLTDFKNLLDEIGNTTHGVHTGGIQPKVDPPLAKQPAQPKVPLEMKVPSAGTEMPKVPSHPPVSSPVQPVQETTRNSKETKISWIYLMRHYNKENAERYKAQKAENKGKAELPKTSPQLSTPGFAVPGMKETVSTSFAVPGQPVAQAPQQPVQQPKVAASPVAQQPVPAYQQPIQSAPAAQAAIPISFGETTVLGGGIGETTVLGTTSMPNKVDPYLFRTKNNERIPLNKPVFRIGKERSYVDYFVSDNTAISRSHANIINRNGEFYVVDTNSTNHTYVDGSMIQSNVETKLTQGTKIRLANEDFEFRLY